ncbi:putative bifunctional diguanylate cyclase/phosphodiesterase [Mycolicibacterium aichiense]|uniref:GGDEF-domain containing protein n=1 Tax=Mycolicibacterium aichiense TaxID=1799 RepID=A0AAD1HNX0_9MYCO|nr:EAL domain-containing protein [Mycolicibacterium aichiense]MCV7018540.1 EAL domain-containing protein [Mycolicibacterium aichiense]BBX07296.1 GGDEF-domain containing protein [Mycolicibacterium aichiense]STZ81110.1 diguanylate cyclase/phosphodiesterase [Mycolicibacterium aichiense]
MPRTSRAAVGAVVVFAVFISVILSGRLHGSTLTVVDDFALLALATPAVVFSALAARSLWGRRRLAWLSMTIGLLGWTVGEAIWTFYEVHLHRPPFPSVADVAFLVMPVGACAALLLLPAEHTSQSRARLFLDGVIMAGSLFLVSWVTILHPLYQSYPSDQLGFVISLAYPLSDIIILTVAGVALVRSSGQHRLSLTLLTAGLACFALADSAFAYLSATGSYSSGSVIDIGWAAGLLFITVAASAAHDGKRKRRNSFALPGWASVWLPYTPLLVAGVVAAAQPVPDLKSRPVLIVASILVVTVLGRQFLAVKENRLLVATVADQALHDPLTGLANRALFSDRLSHAMHLHEREGMSLAVLAVDLNEFKLVNDHLGHLVGDDLLVGVAQRLRRCVRPGDTVARLGGDEFSILVEGGNDVAELVGNRVVEAFEEPFVLSDHELLMRPSVGLALAEPDEPHLTAEELMRRADAAMYSAKRSRARVVQVYHPDIAALDEAADRRLFGAFEPRFDAGGAAAIELLGKLRQAIDKSELTLVYQAKVDLRTAENVGAEALIRWPQPDGTVLAPEEFLPLVRRHGLMGQFTQLVIGKALDDALAWRRAGLDLPIAVNLFAPSVANIALPATITEALAERGLPPTALTVEITEELFLDSTERTRAVLQELRRNGIRIAIDDFGSGYSALSYLRDLPIDEVKLDRSFIAPILVDARAAAVVRAVVDLAHVLDLTVVVEGVEDVETAALVQELGCDVGQGFFYGVPVAPDELLEAAVRKLRAIGPTH